MDEIRVWDLDEGFTRFGTAGHFSNFIVRVRVRLGDAVHRGHCMGPVPGVGVVVGVTA